MKRILLSCSAGMSTNILVKKVKDVAVKEDKTYEIEAIPMVQAKLIVNNWDITLLGPQVSFVFDDFRAIVNKGREL